MIDTGPNFGSRNTVGSGMIKLVWNESATLGPVTPLFGSTPILRLGKVRLAVGYVSGVAGFILPGLEVHDFATADAKQHAQELPGP